MLKTLLTKIYTKIKPYITHIGIGIGALLFGLFANRRRLPDCNNNIERVSGTVDDLQDGNRDTADTIDKLVDVNTGIKESNVGAGTGIDAAIDGIDRAKEILSKAKHT